MAKWNVIKHCKSSINVKLQEGETVVEKDHRTLLHETKNNNTPAPIAQNITIQNNNIIRVILNLPIPPNS